MLFVLLFSLGNLIDFPVVAPPLGRGGAVTYAPPAVTCAFDRDDPGPRWGRLGRLLKNQPVRSPRELDAHPIAWRLRILFQTGAGIELRACSGISLGLTPHSARWAGFPVPIALHPHLFDILVTGLRVR